MTILLHMPYTYSKIIRVNGGGYNTLESVHVIFGCPLTFVRYIVFSEPSWIYVDFFTLLFQILLPISHIWFDVRNINISFVHRFRNIANILFDLTIFNHKIICTFIICNNILPNNLNCTYRYLCNIWSIWTEQIDLFRQWILKV